MNLNSDHSPIINISPVYYKKNRRHCNCQHLKKNQTWLNFITDHMYHQEFNMK